MALDNPVLAHTKAFAPGQAQAPTTSAEELRRMYEQPAAQNAPGETIAQTPVPPRTVPAEGTMGYDDVIGRTAVLFAVLLAGAVAGWFFPQLMMAGMIVGLVLGLVNSFKRNPSPALILLYGAAEGVFLGGISAVLDQVYPGVVMQAVLATLCVFAVTLVLFATGAVRASARGAKVLLIAMGGYLLFSLVNLGVMMFGGAGGSAWGLNSGVVIFGIPLGVIIGVLAVLMAAYSLVLDFDYIKQGVVNGAPKRFAWQGAFGLTVTLVWLYVELLRLFAILAGNRS
jgi:uncharacterized YccA/Bax inhibitor family protein